MANKFNSANYPEIEPAVMVAGDRWAWKRTDLGSDYDPDDYSLKYSFRLDGDGTDEFEINASESGSDYIVEVAAATTAAYTIGFYRWQAYITRTSDSERVTVDTGIMEVVRNSDASTTDPRTHSKIMLDRCETALEALELGAQSVSVAGRTWTSRDIEQLMRVRDAYKAEHLAEIRKENKSGGAKLVVKLKGWK